MVVEEKFKGEESYKCEPKHRLFDASKSSFPKGKMRNAASTTGIERWPRNVKNTAATTMRVTQRSWRTL